MFLLVVTFFFGLAVIAFTKTKPNFVHYILGDRLNRGDLKTIVKTLVRKTKR